MPSPVAFPALPRMLAALDELEIRNDTVLVACSGGLDSTVLLDLLVRAAPERELTLVVGHIDHGLRGDESEADRKHVEALAASLQLRCETRAIDVDAARVGESNRSRPTRQEAARKLRYQALRSMARESAATRIATAHHLDDQAETVLLRLMRGSTGEGLGGIPEQSPDGRIVRPLLGLRRIELEDHARLAGLSWREDASNTDPKYARNRLRSEWLDGLADAFNPNLVAAIGRLAENQRREREWLEPIVEQAFRERFPVVAADRLECGQAAWSALPEALARRLVGRIVTHLGGGRALDRVQIERTLSFLRAGPGAPGNREIELPEGLRVRRQDNRLVFFRMPKAAGSANSPPGSDSGSRE